MSTDQTGVGHVDPSDVNQDMDLNVQQSAIDRIEEIRKDKNDPFPEKGYLRIAVVGGGCAGFKYALEAEETIAEDDHIFGDAIVVDDVSLEYLRGTIVGFERSMVGSSFTLDNPNVRSSCGCATSFSVE